MDVYQLVEKLGGEIVSNKAVVIIDGEPVEVGGIIDNEFKLNEKGIELAGKQKAPTKRTRARNKNGTLKADDPSTPDVNEAWTDGDD